MDDDLSVSNFDIYYKGRIIAHSYSDGDGLVYKFCDRFPPEKLTKIELLMEGESEKYKRNSNV